MDDVTRAYVQMVERSDATAAQWIAWHLQCIGQYLADPVQRLELRAALIESGELLHDAQATLDSVGEIVAEAGLAREEDRADLKV